MKDNVDIVIQINGKKRSIINANMDIQEETLINLIKKDNKLDRFSKQTGN